MIHKEQYLSNIELLELWDDRMRTKTGKIMLATASFTSSTRVRSASFELNK